MIFMDDLPTIGLGTRGNIFCHITVVLDSNTNRGHVTNLETERIVAESDGRSTGE